MSALDLSELDTDIDRLDLLLKIARECNFTEATAIVEREIVEVALPEIILALGTVDGEERAAIAKRCRRLKQMVANG